MWWIKARRPKFVLFSLINDLYQTTRLELDVTAYMRQEGSPTN